ncbi:MAG TPA: hypothetical protein P5096_03620 [Patescibacteria group bacterium]|nr:hypothetical protein [Patescibacteria group bacterium]
MKKIFFIIFLIILAAGLSSYGVWYWQKSIFDKEKAMLQKAIDDLKANQSNLNQSITVKPETNNGASLNCPKNYTEYISNNLGVGFCYPKTIKNPDSSIGVVVIEEGDKIFINFEGRPISDGQFVEVFNKDKRDTLVQAIEKKLLQGISKDKCWANQTAAPSGTLNFFNAVEYPKSYIFTSALKYPVPTNPEDPFFVNMGDCPKEYAATNGIRAFMMDQNNPDRFFFFSIGQYYIAVENEPAWQETFKVFAK